MSFEKTNELDTKPIVDEIENAVCKELKPFGFRKHGRTLHRFVDGDISQVINFQNGCPEKFIYNVLYVNVGIRVPECELRTFAPEEALKKYYPAYDCNLRCDLTDSEDQKKDYFDLHHPIQEIVNDIICKIKDCVIPAFNTLNSRLDILENQKNANGLSRQLTNLEKAMVFGRMGDMKKAELFFNQYYDENAQIYKAHEGWKSYGYLKSHLDYIEELAEQLNIKIKLLHKNNEIKPV